MTFTLHCPWCRHPEADHDYSGKSALAVLCSKCTDTDGVCDITASAERALARARDRGTPAAE